MTWEVVRPKRVGHRKPERRESMSAEEASVVDRIRRHHIVVQVQGESLAVVCCSCVFGLCLHRRRLAANNRANREGPRHDLPVLMSRF